MHEHDWQLDYHAHAYYCECGANMSLEQLMADHQDAVKHIRQLRQRNERLEANMTLEQLMEAYDRLSKENARLQQRVFNLESDKSVLELVDLPEANQRIRTLEEAGDGLYKYARHDEKCYGYLGHNPCDCGFDAVSKAWQAALETEDAG